MCFLRLTVVVGELCPVLCDLRLLELLEEHLMEGDVHGEIAVESLGLKTRRR